MIGKHWSEHMDNQDDNDQFDAMRTEIAELRLELGKLKAQPVQPASQDLIPRGFEVSHVPDWSALTDEGNRVNRWHVKRIDRPYEGKDGARTWTGPTFDAAMQKACESLGIHLPTQPVQTALTDEQIMQIAKPFIRSVGGYSQHEKAIPDNGAIEDFARAIEAALKGGAT